MQKVKFMNNKRKFQLTIVRTTTAGGNFSLVVMGGDSWYEDHCSNPSTIYWMDIFHIYSL